MKKIFLFFIFQSVLMSMAFADCNLNLVIAAGKYIEELEKAKLTKYQNKSVCEVLDYEIGQCSNTQKVKLGKAFNVNEVHRNYCQPHLPPPSHPLIQEDFMKGAALYSWRDFQGFQWYALLPGTNRMMTTKELIAAKSNEWQLRKKFKELQQSTEISWNNLVGVEDKQNLEFLRPNKAVVNRLTKAAADAKLKILIEQ